MISLINRLKSKKGFTIVELVVIIAIIGVILAMVLPNVFTSDKPAKGNAMAKDFFYKAQDAMTIAKIAYPEAFKSYSSGVTYYVDLHDNDSDGEIDFTTGILSGTSFTTVTGDDAVKALDKFTDCCKNYFVDIDKMNGLVFVKVNEKFAVQSCYWVGVTKDEFAGLPADMELDDDNYIDGYYCGAYPGKNVLKGETLLA